MAGERGRGERAGRTVAVGDEERFELPCELREDEGARVDIAAGRARLHGSAGVEQACRRRLRAL